MSSDPCALNLQNVSKVYHIYEAPHHRLLQMIYGYRRRFFREFKALDDISFQVGRGESVGIIGRNGAGKSTLLQIIAGTLSATSGNCQTSGRITALLELGSGFNPEFTGHENVLLNAAILGMSEKEIAAKYDDIVAFADIGNFLEQPVKTYSSGMKMRLAFAVQAFIDPEILIIDEALSVGDGAFQMKCMQRMREMIEQKTTILLVSHSLQTLRSFCSRVIWLDQGRIKMDGDTREVTGRYSEVLFGTAVQKQKEKADPEQNIREAGPSPDFPVINLETASRTETLRRWGSGEAKVTAFSLHDDSGKMSKVYEFGVTLQLNIEAEVIGELPDTFFSMAFAVKNRQGLDIISISTDRLGIFTDPPDTGSKIKVRFTFPLQIAPGDYSLVLAIAYTHEGRRTYMDYVENAWYFSILSDRPRYGIYEPDATAVFLDT
ncbi:MAG TPA: ABC transporter ATP-binding protein [Candidatus Hydrogenedentes bacterium]|nr:ABC transporter ATP-binding protein [Candidatus Hydrogenedentota bacterium]HOM47296.1 ABC transporter ATP-binding protein [Candidatus Hydrogenedentota bacterium]HOR49664.1 ABC transporter ATP-binding protein [Candidatus Hydrogenedentota bacterium]HPK25147.1 ABC transporter ATP-binding protein [Candidatus Hydrogenedentota bacterium]HQB02887.1 ABC transporter ATP-binding protein [Candidatus Hydrogenedentota bacterium]